MYTDTTPAITTIDEVLNGAAGVREQTRLLERGLVVLAVEWAKHHPITPMPADHPGYDGMEEQWVFDQLYAQGCLAFDDTTVSEFAIAAGLTEYSARKFIRESLMLVHLLPHVWSRVLAGGLDVWRAQQLAGDCFGMTTEAIAFVDRNMAERTARITVKSREGIIAEARKRFMPEEEAAAEEEARNARKVDIFMHETQRGVTSLFALLDLPDALALETALNIGAEALKSAGSDAPLDTRRAWALGDLARAATRTADTPLLGLGDSLESGLGAKQASAQRPQWHGTGLPPQQTTLFLHFSAATFVGTENASTNSHPTNSHPAPNDGAIARVQGRGVVGDAVCDPKSIQEWFTRPAAFTHDPPVIKVRPVLNLAEEISSVGYSPPPRTKQHARLTHKTCVFPFCTRPSHNCDLDHIDPWKKDGIGGATCSCNLAPLCRTHHRLKTHADNAPRENGKHNSWTYTHLGAQEYYWCGPRDMEFITNSLGTFNASPTRNDGAPQHPAVPAPTAESPATQSPARPMVTEIDLGEYADTAATDTLIDRLLTKAAMTRGVHNRDYSPMWTAPVYPASDQPPADYPQDEEMGGSIMFLMPYRPPKQASENLHSPIRRRNELYPRVAGG